MPEFIKITMPESERKRFRSWVNRLSVENQKQCKTIIKGAAKRIQHMAMIKVPVDKSFLKGTSFIRMSSDQLGATVGYNAHYAPYKEFGTGDYARTYLAANPDLSQFASQFRGRGIRKVNLKAKPFFFPAFRIGTKEMEAKLEAMGFKKVQ